jgi:DNA-binding MarR family transcriptional regulator
MERRARRLDPDHGTIESGLGFRLGRAHRLLRDDWEDEIAVLCVTAVQASMLRAICENPGTGVREIARRLMTDPMNAKRVADHLERLGLAESMADASHTQRRGLVPTPKGRAVAAEISARAAAWNRRLARRMGGDDLERLRDLLTRLEDMFTDERTRKGARK